MHLAHAAAATVAASIASVALALPPVVEEIEPVRDTSIFSFLDQAGGASSGLFTGRTGASAGGAANRALLAFDLSSIPADADIVSVELRLFQQQAANGSGDRTLTLHRLTADWGEAGSNAGSGLGAPPEPGDATWTKRFHPDVFWDAAGGDFAGTPSASAVSPQATEVYVSWTGSGLEDDVEAWLEDPDDNHGWILVGDESEPQTGRKFGSRETGNLDGRPTLIVTYEPAGADCPADVNGSGAVDFGDVLAILTNWDNAGGDADVDGNGTVGFGDLLLVLSAYGPC